MKSLSIRVRWLLVASSLAFVGCSSTPTTIGTGQKIILKSMLPFSCHDQQLPDPENDTN